LVLGLVAPNELEALTIRDEAQELLRAVVEATGSEQVTKAQEVALGLKRLHTTLTRLYVDAQKAGHATQVISDIAGYVKERQQNILSEVLEIGEGAL
jgi:hypothetical protein